MRSCREIIENYLVNNNCDGLVSEDYECGCMIGNLFPCESIPEDCLPAINVNKGLDKPFCMQSVDRLVLLGTQIGKRD
jgi:hypothetical protein